MDNNTSEELLKTIMNLIVYGGDSKSNSMQAIYAAKTFDFSEADNLMKQSNDSLIEAHKTQTQLLTQESAGNKVELSLLLVHAQDHLMNAITFKDLASEVIDVYKYIDDHLAPK